MVTTQGLLDRYMHGSYLFHFTVDINWQQADRQSLLTIYAISYMKVTSFLVSGKFFSCKVTSEAKFYDSSGHAITQE
jgi:hypothetical protein